MLGDNKYFIIMYKNKDTESLSATNSEDNHAAIPSCKNPNKDWVQSAHGHQETIFKTFAETFQPNTNGVIIFFKSLVQGTESILWLHKMKHTWSKNAGKIKLKCSGSFSFSFTLRVREEKLAAGLFTFFRQILSPCYKEENKTFFFLLTRQRLDRQNNNMQQEVESTTFPWSLYLQ